MSEESRRSLLESLDLVQYQEVMKVLSDMPSVSIQVRLEGRRKLSI